MFTCSVVTRLCSHLPDLPALSTCKAEHLGAAPLRKPVLGRPLVGAIVLCAGVSFQVITGGGIQEAKSCPGWRTAAPTSDELLLGKVSHCSPSLCVCVCACVGPCSSGPCWDSRVAPAPTMPTAPLQLPGARLPPLLSGHVVSPWPASFLPGGLGTCWLHCLISLPPFSPSDLFLYLFPSLVSRASWGSCGRHSGPIDLPVSTPHHFFHKPCLFIWGEGFSWLEGQGL